MAGILFPAVTAAQIERFVQHNNQQQALMVRLIDSGSRVTVGPKKPVKRAGKPLSPIIERAGRLMAEARPRRIKGRLAVAEYIAIGDKLDQHFKLGSVFRKGSATRKELATWNKTHPQKAIKSFSAALASEEKLPSGTRPRRTVQRWLDRAETKWEECHLSQQH